MMEQLHLVYRRYLQHTLVLLGLYALGWALTPYKTQFLGLALGTIFGIYNIWLLSRKTTKLGEAAVNGKGIRSLGTISRMAAAVLAVAIAMAYPEAFHVIFVVLGLMTGYLVIMIDLFFQNTRRGEKR